MSGGQERVGVEGLAWVWSSSLTGQGGGALSIRVCSRPGGLYKRRRCRGGANDMPTYAVWGPLLYSAHFTATKSKPYTHWAASSPSPHHHHPRPLSLLQAQRYLQPRSAAHRSALHQAAEAVPCSVAESRPARQGRHVRICGRIASWNVPGPNGSIPTACTVCHPTAHTDPSAGRCGPAVSFNGKSCALGRGQRGWMIQTTRQHV